VGVVGVMLPRGGELRCVVRGLSAASAGSLVERMGWAGDPGAVAAVFAGAGAHAVEARLGLGFSPRLAPALGVELLLGSGGETDGQREAVLRALATEGLCGAEEADALRGWSGALTPLTSRAPWPDALLAASLLEPERRLGVLLRYLNHVKIGLRPGSEPRAKAYLGWVHRWTGPAE
jgi:hypothetical protein